MVLSPVIIFKGTLISILYFALFVNIITWLVIVVLLNIEFLIYRQTFSVKYDVFLSYRVDAEGKSGLADDVYTRLINRGLRVYLDKECLEDGENWKKGFVDGLTKSSVYVLLGSEPALHKIADEAAVKGWYACARACARARARACACTRSPVRVHPLPRACTARAQVRQRAARDPPRARDPGDARRALRRLRAALRRLLEGGWLQERLLLERRAHPSAGDGLRGAANGEGGVDDASSPRAVSTDAQCAFRTQRTTEDAAGALRVPHRSTRCSRR